MPRTCERPEWLPGYTRRDDPNHAPQRRPPTGIVLHSGESGPDLAGAALRMPISYHFAWSPADRAFVQLVSLQRRAYHAGRDGNDWLGVALSGPWSQDPRDPHELGELYRLCRDIRAAMPCVVSWCRHSDITRGKRDPGPGVDGERFGGETELRWRMGPRG